MDTNDNAEFKFFKKRLRVTLKQYIKKRVGGFRKVILVRFIKGQVSA